MNICETNDEGLKKWSVDEAIEGWAGRNQIDTPVVNQLVNSLQTMGFKQGE